MPMPNRFRFRLTLRSIIGLFRILTFFVTEQCCLGISVICCPTIFCRFLSTGMCMEYGVWGAPDRCRIGALGARLPTPWGTGHMFCRLPRKTFPPPLSPVIVTASFGSYSCTRATTPSCWPTERLRTLFPYGTRGLWGCRWGSGQYCLFRMAGQQQLLPLCAD